ncbi:MAG: type II toxin-antitoxin system RelE/ParE family toxin [Fimbriimonadales bacterium]
MRRLDLTDTARLDLAEIHQYIGEDNPRAADAMINHIWSSCDLLREYPNLGRARPQLGVSGMRATSVGNYSVYYLPTDEAIIVVRVIHHARKLTRAYFRDILLG